MNPISIQSERPKFSCLKSMHFYSICILIFFLFIIFVVPCDAQPWKQMGPGAGGQERALYLHTNHAGNYELFVGSDVSGIWRSSSINPNDINNPDQYRFKYISNHRIFRFVNKFYHPDSYDSEFLFALNRSGIDRIDLNDPSAEMKSVNINYGTADFSESWVSDIYIGAPDPNGDKVVYFTTGNTRVSDNVIKNHKHSSISDIYLGILNSSEDEITINALPISLGLNPPYKDVYCLLVDDNGTSQLNDDIIFVGSDLALHVGDFTNGLVAVTPPIDITAVNRQHIVYQ